MLHLPTILRGVPTSAVSLFLKKWGIANGFVKKTIAEVKENRYTSSHGKSDQDKGLGREVEDGTL